MLSGDETRESGIHKLPCAKSPSACLIENTLVGLRNTLDPAREFDVSIPNDKWSKKVHTLIVLASST